MTADKPTAKTLRALGVNDARGVAEKFAEVRALFDAQAHQSMDRQNWETLRQSWVGRKSGVLTAIARPRTDVVRSEEHTSELQSRLHLVCRPLLAKTIRGARRPPQAPASGTMLAAKPDTYHLVFSASTVRRDAR